MHWTVGRLAACGALLVGAAFALGHASCASVTGLDSDPCTASSPPPPPSTPGGADGPDIVLALRNLRFAVDYGNDGGSVSVRGLDLDHSCSKENGTPTTCTPSPVATPHKDDSHGGDNAMGWLLVDNQIQLNRYLTSATDPRISVLLRLTGYNGEANDDQVLVEAFVTGGVEPLDEAGIPAEPQWNGSDRWTVSCETLPICDGGTVLTQASDPHAYVSGDVLVVPGIGFLPLASSTQLSGGGFFSVLVNLYDPLLVAPLTHGDAGPEVHGGLLGARWPTTDMITAIAGVCIGPDVSKRFVCTRADLAKRQGLDNTGHPCDAFSVGIGFDAYPATMTSHVVPIAFQQPCEAGPSSDCP